jgi:hypothetical protein
MSMSARIARRFTVLILAEVVSTAPAIAHEAAGQARLLFSDNPARFGDPVTVEAEGLASGQTVTIRAEKLIPSRPDSVYRSEARFRADATGRIDLARDAPIEGAWSEADINGLFWAMRSKEEAPPNDLSPDHIAVQLLDDDGEQLARAVLHYPAARTALEEEPLHAGVAGAFLLKAPTDADAPRPAIVLLGGSEAATAQRGPWRPSGPLVATWRWGTPTILRPGATSRSRFRACRESLSTFPSMGSPRCSEP